jgi:hypothetical protein
MKRYDFYADPGHGWLKVPRTELYELGISSLISCFSYVRGAYAYLEEDNDLSTFLRAKRATGVQPSYRHHHTDRYSRIRHYASYSPQGAAHATATGE